MEATPLPAEVNQRHRIPGIAEVVTGNGGLAKVRITSRAATGEIYLHGAHVTSWSPEEAEEALFLSSASKWEDGKAIRGGVPICFPWFGDKADDPSAPAHGFVRTKPWSLESIASAADAVTVSMSTVSDETTKHWWPADFRAVYRASFGAATTVSPGFTTRPPRSPGRRAQPARSHRRASGSVHPARGAGRIQDRKSVV